MKKLGLALLIALALTVGVTTIVVLHANTKSHQRASTLATQACRRPTDAARRTYVRAHAAADHLSYVEAMTDMYATCPTGPVRRPRLNVHPRLKIHARRTGSIGHTKVTHEHSTGEEDDDGGD